MKKPLLLIAYHLLIIAFSHAQNLVPNGDFEQYAPCPPSYGYLNSATSWFSPALLTPDYFNVCAGTNGAGVPDNAFGYQLPHSGNGYAGIYGLQFPYLNVREYTCAQLTQPLTAGTPYLVQYYLNLSEKSQYAVTTYGAYLAASASVTMNGYLINAVPQIENTVSLLTDTIGWLLISGTFVAAGGEQYIIIGSFKDDSTCGMQLINSGAVGTSSYYYIDDVSVTSLTSLEQQHPSDEIKIYPNPVKDWINVQIPIPVTTGTNFQNKKAELKIVDLLGREILFQNPKQLESAFRRMNIENFKSGIYFIEINDGKNIFRKKFLKE